MTLPLLLGAALGLTSVFLYVSRTEPSKQVLSETTVSIPSPTATPTASPTPRPTLTPQLTKIPTPIPTPFPVKTYTPQEVHGFIERYASQYSLDVNVLRHVAVCESGFNPHAVNDSYVGLYQFGPTAWKNNRAIMGEDGDLNLRYDAEESAQTAAYLISIGRSDIWPNCFPR